MLKYVFSGTFHKINGTMKINSKIKIDLLDFIKNGKFDYVKLGQTSENHS